MFIDTVLFLRRDARRRSNGRGAVALDPPAVVRLLHASLLPYLRGSIRSS